MTDPALDTVIFDLGKVLLNWEPDRAFAAVLPDDEVAAVMEEISFSDWNHASDAGRPFDVGESELIKRFPHRSEAILAYRRHFARTLTGMVPGTNAIVAELQQAGVRLVALTNWSGELFPIARERFGILDRFEGIVVSGDERLAKPDPAIFTLLFERYHIDPVRAAFLDDSPRNCATARDLGITAIDFVDADSARDELVDLGLLAPREGVPGPIFHIAERQLLDEALREGYYPWSTRDVTFDQQGYVHCARADQVATVLERFYADLDESDLVVLELDPGDLTGAVIVEQLGNGESYPHVFAPLDISALSAAVLSAPPETPGS